jgi:putative transposase
MRTKAETDSEEAEKRVRDIRRATRRQYSAEEKIRIVRALKKRARRWRVRYMRYAAGEKLEVIRLVEQSSLPVRRTLAQLGIPRSTFYAWDERYLARGAGALEDGQPAPPRRVWNKLPDTVAEAVLELALKEPALSPRE